MNGSLQRYVHFRQMMMRQSEGQEADSLDASSPFAKATVKAPDGQLFERSAVLQEAVERVEALRLTLKALGEARSRDLLSV